MEARLRLLCCWGYSRAGWVAPLEALGAEHGFDLTYLFHRRPEEETAVKTSWPRRYWLEFRSAQQVLDELQPDRIVFMGLDGAWTIALNAVARRRGIPTFLLQHGIEWPSIYESAGWGGQLRGPGAAAGITLRRRRLPALRFLGRSLASRPQDVARTVLLLRAAASEGFVHAAPRRVSEARLPSLHLVTGPASGLAAADRDGAAATDMSPVGLPELAPLLDADLPVWAATDAVLLIDTPHTGGPDRPVTIPGAAKAALLQGLGDGLRRHDLRLRVKLHPYSYGDGWAVDTEDITYLRDVDLLDELRRAVVVIGFDSTLLLAALRHRPVVIVRAEPSWLPDLAEAIDATVVDGLPALTADVVLKARAAGRTDGQARLLVAFAGPGPWSTEPLAAAIRDPAHAPRVDATDLALLSEHLRAATDGARP